MGEMTPFIAGKPFMLQAENSQRKKKPGGSNMKHFFKKTISAPSLDKELTTEALATATV